MSQFPGSPTPPPQSPYPVGYPGFDALPPPRPTSVTVLAIVAMVIGALSVLCCGSLGLGGAILGRAPVTAPNGTVIMPDMKILLFSGGVGLLNILTGIGLIAAGVGAMQLRRWARRLAIGLSIVILLMAISSVVANLTWVGPHNAKMVKQMQPPSDPNAQLTGTMIDRMTTATAIVMCLVEIITPALILLLWTRPQVKAAFGEATA